MKNTDSQFLSFDLEENHGMSGDESRCSSLMVSDSSSSSSSSSSLLGDYIGMESCDDLCVMEKNGDDDQVGKAVSRRLDKWNQRWRMKNKEFPPPIPLLARTGNLSSHMPWVLRRQYTSDGRLILTEEKVKHHEYFMAHRSNGRLTLHLVPLDHDDLSLLPPPLSTVCNEVESELGNESELIDDHQGGRDEIDQSRTMVGSAKCLNYDDARSSSSPCRFEVPVATARIVRS